MSDTTHIQREPKVDPSPIVNTLGDASVQYGLTDNNLFDLPITVLNQGLGEQNNAANLTHFECIVANYLDQVNE